MRMKATGEGSVESGLFGIPFFLFTFRFSLAAQHGIMGGSFIHFHVNRRMCVVNYYISSPNHSAVARRAPPSGP